MKLEQITEQFEYLSPVLLHPVLEQNWLQDDLPRLVETLKAIPGEVLKRAAEDIHQRKHEEVMLAWSKPSIDPPEDEMDEEIEEEARRARLLVDVLRFLQIRGEPPYKELGSLDSEIAATVDWTGLPNDLRYLADYADEFGISWEHDDWRDTWNWLSDERKDELNQLSARVGRDMASIDVWLESSKGSDAYHRVFVLRAFLSEMCGDYMDG